MPVRLSYIALAGIVRFPRGYTGRAIIPSVPVRIRIFYSGSHRECIAIRWRGSGLRDRGHACHFQANGPPFLHRCTWVIRTPRIGRPRNEVPLTHMMSLEVL